MSFYSQHADKIWNNLYTVCIPDAMTMNPDYTRIFGVPISGCEQIDKDMVNQYTTVKIPIITIMSYFEEGIVVMIPSREDMLDMHRAIDLYLSEWTEYLRTSINDDGSEHKDLISGLDKMSKLIYGKAAAKEIGASLFPAQRFGLVNPLQASLAKQEDPVKPNYNSITELLKKRQKASRF